MLGSLGFEKAGTEERGLAFYRTGRTMWSFFVDCTSCVAYSWEKGNWLSETTHHD